MGCWWRVRCIGSGGHTAVHCLEETCAYPNPSLRLFIRVPPKITHIILCTYMYHMCTHQCKVRQHRLSSPVKDCTHSKSGVCIFWLNNAFYVSPFTASLGFHPASTCMTCPQKEFPNANVDEAFLTLEVGKSRSVKKLS